MDLADYGPAGVMAAALIATITLLLKFWGDQQRTERESHEKEIERVIGTHERAIEKVTGSIENTGRDITGELRAVREAVLVGRGPSNPIGGPPPPDTTGGG